MAHVLIENGVVVSVKGRALVETVDGKPKIVDGEPVELTIKAPDEVRLRWTYDSVAKTFSAPVVE